MSFSSNRALAAAAVLALALLAPAAARAAQPLAIKMATLAPEGSAWFKVLQDMGAEWKKGTNGAVTLKIYPGGIAGDEDSIIRKMRVGQLQAAAVTGLGLTNIDRSFYALHVPMMYRTDEEFEYVRGKIAPLLERKLEEKGFVLLNWGDAGWVHFFAKKPFARPAEVKAMKLYVGSGDSNLTQLFKETGFQPVSLTVVDILPGLQTGMIDAFNATPLAALAFQWFGLAKNMSDLRWAPLPGATIIDRKTWLSLPEATRAKVLESARTSGRRVQAEVRRLNDEALAVMVKNGLKVTHVTPEVEGEWRKMMEDIAPRVRGKVVPPDVYDLARKYRDEYRASRGSAR
jgi:TRAP-type C4-dicarboxylate transport system substrate-binding protein